MVGTHNSRPLPQYSRSRTSLRSYHLEYATSHGARPLVVRVPLRLVVQHRDGLVRPTLPIFPRPIMIPNRAYIHHTSILATASQSSPSLVQVTHSRTETVASVPTLQPPSLCFHGPGDLCCAYSRTWHHSNSQLKVCVSFHSFIVTRSSLLASYIKHHITSQ